MGTLIDIMTLNRSDCVQTVGWWHMTDSKIEFGEDKKNMQCDCIVVYMIGWSIEKPHQRTVRCSTRFYWLKVIFYRFVSPTIFLYTSIYYWFCYFQVRKDAPQDKEKRWKNNNYESINRSIMMMVWFFILLCWSIRLLLFDHVAHIVCEWAHYKFGIGQTHQRNKSCAHQMALGPNNSIWDFFCPAVVVNVIFVLFLYEFFFGTQHIHT